MDLYLLRHGESGKTANQSGGSKSSSRNPGLTEDGKKEITRIAKSIKRFKITFDTILTSPLNSTTQTAKIISSTLKMKVNNIINCNELLPERDSLELYNRLQHIVSESSVLISTRPAERVEELFLMMKRYKEERQLQHQNQINHLDRIYRLMVVSELTDKGCIISLYITTTLLIVL